MSISSILWHVAMVNEPAVAFRQLGQGRQGHLCHVCRQMHQFTAPFGPTHGVESASPRSVPLYRVNIDVVVRASSALNNSVREQQRYA